MSITDELREWIASLYTPNSGTVKMEGERIADRIDEQHEDMRYDFQHEFDGWKFIRDTQWVELPKDADGNTINVGDIVALRDEFEVRGLVLVDKNLWVVENRFGESFNPDKLHHVKPDTWEDIIEDAMRYARETNMPYPSVSHKGDELVERCRRLAGEA